MSLLSWISNLGEKSSRTDVWVVSITTYFWLCAFRVIQCEYNFTIFSILIGMFADMGINLVKEVYKIRKK